MKKYLLLSISLMAFTVMVYAQQTFTVTNSNLTYTPATLTITVGDTVEFIQGSSHPAREVSQATWNANMNTSNGGFNNAHSGVKIKFTTVGTVYYVCSNHASSGMKGQIIVQAANSVQEETANVSLKAYPSPVVSNLNLVVDLNETEELTIEVYNVIGEQVYSQAETTFAAGKNMINIDFSDFSNGAYFVKIIGKNDQYSVKILK
jgi:plastocyanin